MEEREIKIPITCLKDYLKEVGITVTLLSNLSGINVNHLNKCLDGEVDDRSGQVRVLSKENIARLQEALHQLSLKLKYLFIYYNPDKEEIKTNGHRYCRDCVEQIRDIISPYFRLQPFLNYTLGWNRSKVLNTMNKKSIGYGNITQADVNRINIALAEMATRFDRLTLV